MNNLKYGEMSLIGKVWAIAELLQAGIRDKKDAYIIATFKKLSQLQEDKTILKSNTIKLETIDNIMVNATEILHKSKFNDTVVEFENDGSIISTIWNDKIIFDNIKEKIKKNQINEKDIQELKIIFKDFKKILLSNESLTKQETLDFVKIFKEIKHVNLNIENRVNRNQIVVL